MIQKFEKQNHPIHPRFYSCLIRLKYFLFLSCFISSIAIKGQDFGPVGTQWHYSGHAQGACPGNCEYVHLESISDTLIKGKTTHKITHTYYRVVGDTIHFDPMYLYQEQDTVFMWSFTHEKFLKTFVFNGNIGDTLVLDYPDGTMLPDSTYRLIIDTINTVVIDGVTLKKYQTTALDYVQFYNGGWFMDKIGGLDWFLPRGAIIPEDIGPIRCYSDQQIDTNFQNVDCDFILYASINNLINDNQLEIYPNPVSENLTINYEKPIQFVEVFDLKGKRIISTQELNIDCSNFSNGQYVMVIHLESGGTIKKSFIKNAQ